MQLALSIDGHGTPPWRAHVMLLINCCIICIIVITTTIIILITTIDCFITDYWQHCMTKDMGRMQTRWWHRNDTTRTHAGRQTTTEWLTECSWQQAMDHDVRITPDWRREVCVERNVECVMMIVRLVWQCTSTEVLSILQQPQAQQLTDSVFLNYSNEKK